MLGNNNNKQYIEFCVNWKQFSTRQAAATKQYKRYATDDDVE